MAENHKNVILSLPEPRTWTFMAFETEAGRDVALDWDTRPSFEAEQAFYAMIRNSRNITNHLNWTAWRHGMDEKAGEAGVVELGFKADKPYRVLCMFNGRKCIIVLCVAYHKQQVWSPKDAVKIATERAKLVTAGKAKLNVIQIENDL